MIIAVARVRRLAQEIRRVAGLPAQPGGKVTSSEPACHSFVGFDGSRIMSADDRLAASILSASSVVGSGSPRIRASSQS